MTRTLGSRKHGDNLKILPRKLDRSILLEGDKRGREEGQVTSALELGRCKIERNMGNVNFPGVQLIYLVQ